MDALGLAISPIVHIPTIQIIKHMEPGFTSQPSQMNKKQKQPILEADLLEDLVFNDANLEDVFNEKRIPSVLPIPPLS